MTSKKPREPAVPAGRNEPEAGRGSSRWRGLALNLLLSVAAIVLFLGGVELILTLIGIRPIAASEDPYVGFQSSQRLFEATGDGAMRTATRKLEFFNRQRFPRRKSPETLRVFTLGGSTTYGRPYDDATSFSAWLRAYLSAVDPGRRWEVINAGGISYASYRVALLMEELVDYEPDLFIVYSGNNEFLERRTYSDLLNEPPALTRTRLLLQRSRLWALGRSLTDRSRRLARERYELTGEVNELLNTSAGLNFYHRDTEFTRQVLHHYRFNLQRMVGLARARGAEVLFVTVPVNEGSFPPFKSQHRDGLSREQRNAVAQRLEEGNRASDEQDWNTMLQAADRALGIDALFAESHFSRGTALMGLGATAEAEVAFSRAVAEDVCPLRAIDEINEAILDTARRNNVGLVDFRALLKSEMERSAGHRILGDEFFLDHVHPTVRAHGLLAAALIDEIAAMGLLSLRSGQLAASHTSVEGAILSRVTPEATARAHKNLARVLIWAGKSREAERHLNTANEALKDNWEVHFQAATLAMRERGDHDTALERLTRALELRPDSARAHDLLAVTYGASGNLEKAVEAGLRAVALDPDSAQFWSNLSVFLRESGDLDRALHAVGQALRLDPNYADAWNNLGNLQTALGQLEKGLGSYKKAISLREDFPEAKTNAGLILARQQRWAEAERYFRDVVEVHPEALMARLALSRLLILTGEPRQALPLLDEVLRLDPKNPAAIDLKGLALAGVSGSPEHP